MKPGQIDRQLARLPDGTTYFCIAKTLSKPGGGFREPSSHYSIGIGCEVSFAPQLVYADGMDLGSPEAAVPVGVHCRLCERRDCRQRAFPSLNDPAVRGGAGG
jgi:predicted transcriptional regulator